MDNISLGKYIVQLREERFISQRKLAEIAGVTNSTISRIESGAVKPDPITLEKVSGALGIDKVILLSKYGYNEIPEDFVIIARRAGNLSEEHRKQAFIKFNETIDKFLEDYDDDEED